jgi:TldD protein
VWSLAASTTTVLPEPTHAFDALPLGRLVTELVALNRAASRAGRGIKVETAFTIRTEEWFVARSDGTRSRFRMPRATAANHATLDAAGGSVLSASAAASAPSYELLLDAAPRARLELRSRRAIERLARLAAAPHFPAGSYPLVIDYALAKGLAHEAFGHASESDSYGSSCLAKRGVFRHGLEVAVPTLSIIDEPVYGDHAYQPVGANGGPRLRATIVDRGRLNEGLGDVFTARQGGVRVTGAERAESYRSIPLPRMSNIRIEMSDPRPLPRPFDELEPEDVRDLLVRDGLLGREPVAYLSGYRGGQVNTMRGDFVFNCGAIYLLRRDRIETYRPAIFSGHFLSALGAVRVGFGPLHLDAIGTCGKWGQHVPSSGGSNALLYLERRDDVKIGGRG